MLKTKFAAGFACTFLFKISSLQPINIISDWQVCPF